MSRLNDLLRQVANIDPQLAKDLRRETDALADRRAFGLNFERHTPEAVELPGRPIRKNDKVRVLPERGEMPTKDDERLYRVIRLHAEGGDRSADIVALDNPSESRSVIVDNLVVVAEFRDPIYPGLVSTGKIDRRADKPFHTVINGENYHALQAILYTHRGAIDCIYIDPPYNSGGARDWKYNNNYVETDDHYRHSKWLAMMERRLLLAKELLAPQDSILIVTIDEKEYLRLGLLLEQTFPEAQIQMVSSQINPAASARAGAFGRVDEYIFFVRHGNSVAQRLSLSRDWVSSKGRTHTGLPRWDMLRRSGGGARRQDSPGGFYPIYVDPNGPKFVKVGAPLPPGRSTPEPVDGTVAILPLRKDGTEGRWMWSAPEFERRQAQGRVRITGTKDRGFVVSILKDGEYAKITAGEFEIVGTAVDGSLIFGKNDDATVRAVPGTQWRIPSHDATQYGSRLLRDSIIPGREFPFPKSLYAVEDTIRFFVSNKPNAIVLDFFAGSGTTAHAVMRLNKQDAGNRIAISITNNEVSADEQKALREAEKRPGEADWEQWGICEYITKPRIRAAITGRTPDEVPIKGDYKFTDEFPMSEGFEENVEFFTLTYESAMRVASNREFAKIAPFLWLRAGSRGRRIDDIAAGWDVSDTYGVIANLDLSEPFIKAIEGQAGLTHAFIVTDEDRLFEAMVRQLPDHVEPVRLYSSYLRNFEIEAGRAAR
ncbi:DNA methyltransferase [Gordonia hongkongensis]|uniref:site-specific DNA-methyltransferase n=1 Tax=Gordonia hongkongensis TaxID=1701090 RepID=UPI0030CDA7C6